MSEDFACGKSSFHEDLIKDEVDELRTRCENDRSLGTTYQTCPALKNHSILRGSSNDDTADELEVFSLLEDEKLPGFSASSDHASTSSEADNVLEKLTVPSRLKETKLPTAHPKTSLATKKFISMSQGSLVTIAGPPKANYSHVQSKVKQYIDDMKAKDRKKTPEEGSHSHDISSLQLPDLSLEVFEAQPLLEKLKQARETIRLQQEEYCKVLRENSQLRNLVDELRMQLQSSNPAATAKGQEVRPPWNPKHFKDRTASLSSLSSTEAASIMENPDLESASVPRHATQKKERQRDSATEAESSSTSYKKLPGKPGPSSKGSSSQRKAGHEAAVQTEKELKQQEHAAVNASSLEGTAQRSASPVRRYLQKVSKRKPTPYAIDKRITYVDLTEESCGESPTRLQVTGAKTTKTEATQTKAILTNTTNTVQRVILLEKLREAAWIASQLRQKAEHLYCKSPR